MVFLLFVGCTLGVKKGFLITQQTFNEMVANYHDYYKSASSEKQRDLTVNVHPKVVEALILLEGINEGIRLGIEPSQVDKNRFRELRYELYQKLPQIFHMED